MNVLEKEKLVSERDTRRRRYLARGALLWGSIYTTGVSGITYLIAPHISGETPHYSVVIFSSLLICPSCGAVSGYIRWRLAEMRSALPKRMIPENKPSDITRITEFKRRRDAA